MNTFTKITEDLFQSQHRPIYYNYNTFHLPQIDPPGPGISHNFLSSNWGPPKRPVPNMLATVHLHSTRLSRKTQLAHLKIEIKTETLGSARKSFYDTRARTHAEHIKMSHPACARIRNKTPPPHAIRTSGWGVCTMTTTTTTTAPTTTLTLYGTPLRTHSNTRSFGRSSPAGRFGPAGAPAGTQCVFDCLTFDIAAAAAAACRHSAHVSVALIYCQQASSPASPTSTAAAVIWFSLSARLCYEICPDRAMDALRRMFEPKVITQAGAAADDDDGSSASSIAIITIIPGRLSVIEFELNGD